MSELKGKIYLPGKRGESGLNYPDEHYNSFEELIRARPEISCDHPECIGYHVVDPDEYKSHLAGVHIV